MRPTWRQRWRDWRARRKSLHAYRVQRRRDGVSWLDDAMDVWSP